MPTKVPESSPGVMEGGYGGEMEFMSGGGYEISEHELESIGVVERPFVPRGARSTAADKGQLCVYPYPP